MECLKVYLCKKNFRVSITFRVDCRIFVRICEFLTDPFYSYLRDSDERKESIFRIDFHRSNLIGESIRSSKSQYLAAIVVKCKIKIVVKNRYFERLL